MTIGKLIHKVIANAAKGAVFNAENPILMTMLEYRARYLDAAEAEFKAGLRETFKANWLEITGEEWPPES